MTVVIKSPYQNANVVNVDSSLESLQTIVGGYIESVPLGNGVLLVCNDEGKLQNLPANFFLNDDVICGTVFFCGSSDCDFCSLDEIQVDELLHLFNDVE